MYLNRDLDKQVFSLRKLMVLCLSIPVMVVDAQVLTESTLPIVIIETHGQIILDEPKITADMKVIYNGPGIKNSVFDNPDHYHGKIGIEYRGSSSQSFPKKPFSLETRDTNGMNRNVALLDMPAENDWVLNAAYNDKSLIRDALAYSLAGSIMNYAPRHKFVELILDGKYQGIYLLGEKIKRDKNRVNIENLEPQDSTGNDLTGGYIIKIDKESGSNSSLGWVSPYKPFLGAWQHTLFQIEYPKVTNITGFQKAYIQSQVTKFEHVMAGTEYTDPVNGFRKYVDESTLVDYIILNELTKNPDAYRLSTFFYKDRDDKGGKLKFGPAWDFNLAFGNVDYCTQGDPDGLVITQFNNVCPGDFWVIHFWWKKFMEDPAFVNNLEKRWRQLRQFTLSNDRVQFLVDSLDSKIKGSTGRNFQKWPILGAYVWPNYFVGVTHAEEIIFLENWLKERLYFLDLIWGGPNRIDEVKPNHLSLYPSPASIYTRFRLDEGKSDNLNIFLTDVLGRQFQPVFQKVSEGEFEIILDQFAKGFYIVQAASKDRVYRGEILILGD